MNAGNAPNDPVEVATLNADMMRRLIVSQGQQLNALWERNAALQTANEKLSNELLDASEARAEYLVELKGKVEDLAALNRVVVAQRDSCEKALRNLAVQLLLRPGMREWVVNPDTYEKARREALELLHIIDDLREKDRIKD